MMTTTVAAESGLQLTTPVFGWEAEKLLVQMDCGAHPEAVLPRGNGSARTAAQEVDWYGTVLPLLRHVFINELRVRPEQYGCVLILPTCMSMEDKEDLLDVMFDDLKVPKLTLQPTGPLALGAAHTGGATGLVLSWGNSLQITPVCDCTILRDKERTVRFGGEEVTAYLSQLLETERGVSLRRDGLSLDHSDLRKMKEQYAYVAEDFDAQKLEPCEQVCVLGRQQSASTVGATAVPNTVTLDSELFTCTELLFNPGLGGYDLDGVHEMIAEVLADCPIDYRKDLARHIVIVGGNTCFPGACAIARAIR
jgi:actin-related protein